MTPEQQGSSRAERFRAQHHLGHLPLGDLAALIEQTTNHDVAVLDAHPDEHGLTMRDPARNVTFIAVARTRNPMRQRSTLAHELAHALFGDWDSTQNLSTRSHEEIRADAFARHLLIPGDGLREFIGDRHDLTEADLSAVVQWFQVSPPIAAIALSSRSLIDNETKQSWMSLGTPNLATRFGWSDQYQSLQNDANRTRSPQRFGPTSAAIGPQPLPARGVGAPGLARRPRS